GFRYRTSATLNAEIDRSATMPFCLILFTYTASSLSLLARLPPGGAARNCGRRLWIAENRSMLAWVDCSISSWVMISRTRGVFGPVCVARGAQASPAHKQKTIHRDCIIALDVSTPMSHKRTHETEGPPSER